MLRERCDIILPTCGQNMLVRESIESIIRCTRYPFRLIVVDDGSPPEATHYLSEVERSGRVDMRLIRPIGKLGWIRAVNRGLEESKDSKYVCFQNDDTVVTEGWLRELVSLCEKDPSIGIITPSWEMPEGADIAAYAAGLKQYAGQAVDTDYCRGHSFFIRREVVEKIGGFDTAYIPAYYDDRDYSLKAIAAGYRCVQAQGSFVAHVRNVSMASAMSRQAVRELMERNGRIFYKRWGYPLRIVVVLKDVSGSGELLRALCRDQNKVIVMAAGEEPVPYEHTAMKVRRSPARLLAVKALIFLVPRRSAKPQKGIDLLLTDCPGVKRLAWLATAPCLYAKDCGDLLKKALPVIAERKERDKKGVTI